MRPRRGAPHSVASSGLLPSLADALLTLAHRPPLRTQLSRTALAAVLERTWEAALERLADGYRMALGERAPETARLVA